MSTPRPPSARRTPSSSSELARSSSAASDGSTHLRLSAKVKMKLAVIDSSDLASVRQEHVPMDHDDLSVALKTELPPSRSISPQPKSEPKSEEPAMKLEEPAPAATPPAAPRGKIKSEPVGPQLIGHLPLARQDALRTFIEIPENHYQNASLGRSREALESMTCDCQYEHGVDDPSDACGHGSDCINRLTQVECLPDDCKCRSYCRNQRFQNKQYAAIEIVQTEKKGFGLRAGEDIRKDSFIYEYVGDVVNQPAFLKRMRQYAEDGIRHFYFMMLQKDEYIDATKRGGVGRFANHSCSPNCYVAKWTVGSYVRMGIFANRNIKKDEELTFNYNVDRYGHEAQPCYCGEPNCVGFIGGKTQTDIAAMDDLYLDALGISEEVANLGLKGTKKKKGKKLDEDFIPTLKPLVEKDVPKVVQAMRQTQSRKVLLKLLTRIKLTDDQSALRQLMRLRGFSVMTNILEDYIKDVEILTVAIECMMTWPLIQRNKVEDSKVNLPVKACSESENEVLAELAKKLLAQWESLEYAYRIPKRMKGDDDEDDPPPSSYAYVPAERSPRPSKRQRWDEFIEAKLDIQPLGTSSRHHDSSGSWKPPPTPDPHTTNWVASSHPSRSDILAVIAAASAAAEAAKEAAAAEAQAELQRAAAGSTTATRKRSSKHRKHSVEEKEALKEKRLMKLVGAVVVKCMSKYQKQMDHELFKKHAKELTQLIAEKEKKSSSYKENRLDSLSDEKSTKIKKFAKEYIAKVLRKLEKSGQRRKPASADSALTASASGSTSTPDDTEDADHSLLMDITGGMDVDDPDEDMADDGESPQHDCSPPESASPTSAPPSAHRTIAVSAGDPRVRHQHGEPGWDPDEKVSVFSRQDVFCVGS